MAGAAVGVTTFGMLAAHHASEHAACVARGDVAGGAEIERLEASLYGEAETREWVATDVDEEAASVVAHDRPHAAGVAARNAEARKWERMQAEAYASREEVRPPRAGDVAHDVARGRTDAPVVRP